MLRKVPWNPLVATPGCTHASVSDAWLHYNRLVDFDALVDQWHSRPLHGVKIKAGGAPHF